MNIPRNMDRIRELSDVVLLAEDADGNEKELHTCKAYLSMFSTFFKNLFFSNRKEEEANSGSFKVSCGHEILKLILEILHEHCCDFSMKKYDPETLAVLFKAAAYLDIPAITKMCVEQILGRPSVEMANAVLREGLHDALMKLFTVLPKSELKRFFENVEDSQQLFSKEDVASIYGLLYSKPLPCPSEHMENTDTIMPGLQSARAIYGLPPVCLRHDILCERTWSCSADLPDFEAISQFEYVEQHDGSEIMIITKNSDGKMINFDRETFFMVSTFFHDIVLTSPEITEIEVDVDYLIMKSILAMFTLFRPVEDAVKAIKSSPFLIYNMYRAAGEDNLGMDIIRSICLLAMLEVADCTSLELAIKLNMPNRDRLLEKMNGESLLKWVHNSSDEDPSEYFIAKDSGYEVHYSNKKKPIVSMHDVRNIVFRIAADCNN